ncbi:DUF1330 domain-containing protein [Bradyrhizobium genosp. P]|uniref:DUF1330 domain-containing protein n=1 Tax=Bradyrhizobium genosp. P TaxID=83641 RepID=UPI003CEF3BB3
MKAKFTVALAMVGGFAVGAAAIEGLHAQATAAGYVIAEVTVKDPEKYKAEFVPPATKAIREAGGKYIVQGGKNISFEGEPPAPRVVVFQFDSIDKAQAWWNSQGRKDADAIGNKYATFRVYAAEGVPQ